MSKRPGTTIRGQLQEETLALVYNYIADFIEENGFPPSNRDVRDNCYIALGSVTRYLDLLEARGYITREPGVARSLTLTGKVEGRM